jgi:DNA polymerase III gamma/tau subunit
MYFSNIQGHATVLSQLTDWVVRDDIQGTYLFQGPKGVGKHTTAQIVARYLLCKGTKDDTCRCSVCRLYPDVPDLLEIVPDNSIKVSDIETIETFLSLIPYKSDKRVVVLNDLDKISYVAANGLLKIFEDLKSTNIILAVSSSPDKILPTVLSRTTKIDFNSLAPQEYLSILKTLGHSGLDTKKLKSAIPYLSQSILSDYGTYLEQMKEVPGFVKNFISMDEDDLISLVGAKDQSQSLLHFTESFVLYLNDIMKIHYECTDGLTYEDRFDDLVRDKSNFSDELCLASIEKIRPAIEQYNRGVYVGLKTRLLSSFLWVYTLAQAEKVKKENESKQRND